MSEHLQSFFKSGIKLVALTALAAAAVASKPAGAVVIPGKTSQWQPALTAFNGKLYVAYTGTDRQLNVASSVDGLNFGPSVISSNNTAAVGPGLAAFGGQLYLAWTGTDGKRLINLMSSADGVTWGNKTLLGQPPNFEASLGNPALASSSNQLLIAWNGTDGAGSLNIACIVCVNQNYGTKRTYMPGSSKGVAITSANDNFFVAFQRSTDVVLTLMSSTSANPLNLAQQTTGNTSSVGPGLGSLNGYVYMGWTGPGFNQRLNLSTYQVVNVTGLSLVSEQQVPAGQISNTNPAVASFNGHLYYAWLGTDGRLNIDVIF